jgi:hypothetical protein
MGKPTPSLISELTRAARLGSLQAGLPPILKAAPVAALFAGDAFARATGSRNLVEEKLLGTQEGNIALAGPSPRSGVKSQTSVVNENGWTGVRSMCTRCLQQGYATGHAGLGFGFMDDTTSSWLQVRNSNVVKPSLTGSRPIARNAGYVFGMRPSSTLRI